MTQPTPQNEPITQRSPLVRFIRWLFTPRILGRLFFCVIALVTLLLLFLTVERFRGQHQWDAFLASMKAKGIPTDYESYIPRPVPDDQNFANIPFFKPYFDFVPGTQKWRDTNAINLSQQRSEASYELARAMGYEISGKMGLWPKGVRTDFLKMIEPRAPHPKTSEERPFPPIPQSLQERYGVKGGTHPEAGPALKDSHQAAQLVRDILKESFDPLAEEVRNASSKPYCRFNIYYENDIVCAILLPHLAKIKGLAQRLAWRASAELELGDPKAAFDDALLIFYLRDTIANEPILISYLVRAAIQQIGNQVVWEGLAAHQWSAAQLDQLDRGLEKTHLTEEGYQALLGEMAMGIRLADQVSHLPHSDSAWRDAGLDIPPAGLYFIPSGWFLMEKANYGRGFERLVSPMRVWLDTTHKTGAAAGDDGLKAFQTMLNDVGQVEQSIGGVSFKAILEHRVFQSMMLPALANCLQKAAYAQTTVNFLRIAFALEKHHLAKGQYPESLQGLETSAGGPVPLDLITRQPYKYRRDHDHGYTLYSIGWNAVDDQGKPGTTKTGEITQKEGDWVWRIP